jgi:hypothetical protein
MSWVGTAVAGGAALYGNYLSSEASGKAADAQKAASKAQIAFDREVWQKNLALNKPFYESGVNALGRMNAFEMPSMTLDDFQASPDYQFRVNEGNNSLLSGASAGGMRLSGKTLKALQDYGQKMASNEYGNWYGRRYGSGMDDWNRNAALAGIGQTANSQAINANMNAASGINAATQNIGNANSAAAMQPANSFNNLLSQGLQAYGMYKAGQ